MGQCIESGVRVTNVTRDKMMLDWNRRADPSRFPFFRLLLEVLESNGNGVKPPSR